MKYIEVVINRCYGGFSLSKEAIDRMVELGSEEAKKCLIDKYYSRNGYYIQCRRWDPILVQVVK